MASTTRSLSLPPVFPSTLRLPSVDDTAEDLGEKEQHTDLLHVFMTTGHKVYKTPGNMVGTLGGESEHELLVVAKTSGFAKEQLPSNLTSSLPHTRTYAYVRTPEYRIHETKF